MKNYYLMGAVIGLTFALITAYLALGNSFSNLWTQDENYSGAIPIICAALFSLGAGYLLDRFKVSHSFIISTFIAPPTVLFIGAITGCLISFAINGRLQYAFDWIAKPMFWITVVGLPLSIIIGAFYFAAVKVWQDRGNPKLSS